MQDQCADNDIDWGVRTGIGLFAVQLSKDVFIDPRKYMVRKRLCPGLFKHLLFSSGEKSEFIKKGYLLSGIRDKGHGAPRK